MKKKSTPSLSSRDKAVLSRDLMAARKALEPVLLEVTELTSITDFFLIASGDSTRQVQALTRHLAAGMRAHGFKVLGIEGEREGHWVLMDYGDLVVHLFYHPFREFYDLEGLWIDAPRVPAGNRHGEVARQP